jgi:hypothetical protein
MGLRLAVRQQRSSLRSEVLGLRILPRQGGNRHRRLVIPVKIELVRNLVHRRSDHHHIEIGKVRMGTRPKVFIGDIAPADDGNRAVGGERLVVHPPVDAPEVGDDAEQSHRSQGHGIEHSHFNVRMTIDGEQDSVGGHRPEIIEQQANADSTIGGAQQAFEQNLADCVLAPDEILHIEAALCRVRQCQSRRERIARVGECMKSRTARMRRDPRPHVIGKCGIPVTFQCGGERAITTFGETTRTE